MQRRRVGQEERFTRVHETLTIGGIFAYWSAPLVAGMIHPRVYGARLNLPMDWRVLSFALLLACGVTFLFGLIPALREGQRPVPAVQRIRPACSPRAEHFHAVLTTAKQQQNDIRFQVEVD
jgi:hypothetical protein